MLHRPLVSSATTTGRLLFPAISSPVCPFLLGSGRVADDAVHAGCSWPGIPAARQRAPQGYVNCYLHFYAPFIVGPHSDVHVPQFDVGTDGGSSFFCKFLPVSSQVPLLTCATDLSVDREPCDVLWCPQVHTRRQRPPRQVAGSRCGRVVAQL